MTTLELMILLFFSVFFLAGLALSLHGVLGLFRENRYREHSDAALPYPR